MLRTILFSLDQDCAFTIRKSQPRHMFHTFSIPVGFLALRFRMPVQAYLYSQLHVIEGVLQSFKQFTIISRPWQAKGIGIASIVFFSKTRKSQPTLENEINIPTSALQPRPLAGINWKSCDIPSVPRCCQADHWSVCTLHKGAALCLEVRPDVHHYPHFLAFDNVVFHSWLFIYVANCS